MINTELAEAFNPVAQSALLEAIERQRAIGTRVGPTFKTLTVADLPANWNTFPHNANTQITGDRFEIGRAHV